MHDPRLTVKFGPASEPPPFDPFDSVGCLAVLCFSSGVLTGLMALAIFRW